MANIIHTIGHSTKTIEEFIKKIGEFGVTTVVDIRSIPYSTWTPQFNRENLSKSLGDKGFNYLFRGGNLGGLKENTLIDETLSELVKLSKTEKIVLMCSEKDYKKCHRYLEITPALQKLSIDVVHIVWDEIIAEKISLF